MPKYRITSREPTLVEYYYTIEAPSPEEAREGYRNGEAEADGWQPIEALDDPVVTIEEAE